MRLRFPAFCFFFAGLLLVTKGLALAFTEHKLNISSFAVGLAALGVWRMPRADTNWRGWIARTIAALGMLAAIPAMIVVLSLVLPSPQEGSTPLLFRLPLSIGFILLTGAWILRCWENRRAHRRWRIGLGLALAWYPVLGLGAVFGWGGGWWLAGLIWVTQGVLLWPPKVPPASRRVEAV